MSEFLTITLLKELDSVFEIGSQTYYHSSRFFPRAIRQKVTALYAFVRVADNFVDQIPQNTSGFFDLRRVFLEARKHVSLNSQICIDSHWGITKKVCYIHALLEYHEEFEPTWTDAFLDSMEMDINKSRYETIEETVQYIYGSANVIGLFMAKLMNLPLEAYHAAEMLGKSMQYINFIRDIKEDLELGRLYFPQEDLKLFGLPSLNKETAIAHEINFVEFLHMQLLRYKEWQQEAEKGFKFIPKRFRIPIKTASDMYNWTARTIEANPLIIFDRQVKPKKRKIITRGVLNIFG